MLKCENEFGVFPSKQRRSGCWRRKGWQGMKTKGNIPRNVSLLHGRGKEGLGKINEGKRKSCLESSNGNGEFTVKHSVNRTVLVVYW